MSIRDHLWNAVQWKVMKDRLGFRLVLPARERI